MVSFGVVLDVDDTLYLERDYVRSGFGAVGRHAAAASSLDAEVLGSFLIEGFNDGVRGTAFDRLLHAFPAVAESCTIDDLVEVYRNHRPEIVLLPDAAELVSAVSGDRFATAVISDGPLTSQTAKVAALGLTGWADTTVLTGVWENRYAKPHQRSFRKVMTDLDLAPSKLVYVADNPAKDFIAPNELGWWTIRVRRPGQLHAGAEPATRAHAAAAEVANLVEAHRVIERWSTGR